MGQVLEIQPSISSGIYYTRVVDFHSIVCSITAFDEVNFNGARCLLLHVWAPNAVVPCMQSTGHMECISGHRIWVNFHQYERRLLHSHLFSCVFIWRTPHFAFCPAWMLSIIQSEAEQRKSAWPQQVLSIAVRKKRDCVWSLWSISTCFNWAFQC